VICTLKHTTKTGVSKRSIYKKKPEWQNYFILHSFSIDFQPFCAPQHYRTEAGRYLTKDADCRTAGIFFTS